MVALLGVLVVPFFVDWSAYRTSFEREAGRLLGHAVHVRGEASAQLLPFPSVTFTDVVVEGADPAAAPLLSVGRFRMDAELAPYLSGEIRIFSMELQRPHLTVPVDASGRVGIGHGPAAGLPSDAMVILENVAISDGRVTIDNRAAGRIDEVTGLDATMSARSLAGPFSGTGRFLVGEDAYALQLSSGSVQPDGALPLRVTVDAPNLDTQVVVDGNWGGEGDAPRFEGALRITSPLPTSGATPGEAAAAAPSRTFPAF